MAMFVLHYWLREFLLPVSANRFELTCEPIATDSTVIQNLSLISLEQQAMIIAKRI